jgi:hypothetical protein
MKCKICLFSIFTLFLIASCSQGGGKNVLPSDCGKNSLGAINCLTTFRALATNPGAYSGLNVTVNGYLVIDGGVLSVYSNKTNYEHGMIEENLIFIRAPVEVQENIFKKFGYRYVRISGEFNGSKHRPGERYEIGTIGGKIKVFELPERVDESKREGWEDVRINVKDLRK